MGEEGLKEQVQHLSLGNKNSIELFLLFKNVKSYIDQHGSFTQNINFLTQNHGVGTKTALLVMLYFAFEQNNATTVDSHVQ